MAMAVDAIQLDLVYAMLPYTTRTLEPLNPKLFDDSFRAAGHNASEYAKAVAERERDREGGNFHILFSTQLNSTQFHIHILKRGIRQTSETRSMPRPCAARRST